MEKKNHNVLSGKNTSLPEAVFHGTRQESNPYSPASYDDLLIEVKSLRAYKKKMNEEIDKMVRG